MGLDFIRKAAKSFVKCWDENRKILATADLFTKEPDSIARSAPFALSPNVALSLGDTLVVEAAGTALIARQRLTEVARADKPPAPLLLAVQQSCGVAKGVVEQVHAVAGMVEISLC